MPGSKLINLIKDKAKEQIPNGIELATVIKSSPLTIRVDNMDISLSGDDLIVCENLTRHERIVTITHVEGTSRNVGDGSGLDLVSGDGDFFTVNDQREAPFDTDGISSFVYEHVKLKFEDVLKKGDRVAVISLPGGQQYLVFDRVVIADG